MVNRSRLIFVAICVASIEARVAHDFLKDYPVCTSEIFCTGDLLHTVQMAKLFPDSKTFVDMKLKHAAELTLKAFGDFMVDHNNNPSSEAVRQFVNMNFEKPGSEFHDWDPSDWKEWPSFLNNVKDKTFQKFGHNVNKIWNILGRKMKDDVAINPELYSIIYVKNGVIVPGGRFREFYYWDSYWIIRGLLYSEMFDTAKGMLKNFFSIIDRYGYIPNGGRIYYLRRSHPPLLTAMVHSYVEFTKDQEFLKEALPYLEREYQFFENNYMRNVNGYALASYGQDLLIGPRPESYREDVNVANPLPGTDKLRFYDEMNAGAESGMDFTSRWFIKNQTNDGHLIDTKCTEIVPVELNAILYSNAKMLADFHTQFGNDKIASRFKQKAQNMNEAIQKVLWNEEHGAWFDYDLINNVQRPYFVPTNLSPLYFGCYNATNNTELASKVLTYISANGIDAFPGGVPNTLVKSGEQWDFPNAWAPTQYLLSEGLRVLNDERATKLANKWTTRWVRSNYIAYNETGYMFEKYSAEELGGHGGGGEYNVQFGFGWSNGVIIEYLAKYGDMLTADD